MSCLCENSEISSIFRLSGKYELTIQNLVLLSSRPGWIFDAVLNTNLFRDYLKNYIQVNVGSADLSANHNVTQIVKVVDEYEKPNVLRQHLREISREKAIIFTATKRSADEVAYGLKSEGIKVASIHGDKSQRDRDRVLDSFRKGYIHVMVATDVAARGLDVKDIKFVFNYDMPNNLEDYIHRIGRTGRAGAVGTAYSFFTNKNSRMAGDLVKILQEANQEVCQDLMSLVGGAGGPSRGGYGRGRGRGRGGSSGSRYSPYTRSGGNRGSSGYSTYGNQNGDGGYGGSSYGNAASSYGNAASSGYSNSFGNMNGQWNQSYNSGYSSYGGNANVGVQPSNGASNGGW